MGDDGTKIKEHMLGVRSYKMVAPAYRQRMKVALEMLSLGKGDKILEMGCGTGENTEVMCRAGASVTAIEISGEELEAAKARVGDMARFMLCDSFTGFAKQVSCDDADH